MTTQISNGLEMETASKTPRVWIAIASHHNDIITGSKPGDVCIRIDEDRPIFVSVDGGTSGIELKRPT